MLRVNFSFVNILYYATKFFHLGSIKKKKMISKDVMKIWKRKFSTGGETKRMVIMTGPSAIGKGKISKEMVSKFNSSLFLLSADSAKVYKHMDIGTNKTDLKELLELVYKREDSQKIDFKKHNLDMVDPIKGGLYSKHAFAAEMKIRCEQLFSEKKTPFLVGGSTLYINSLLLKFLDRDFELEKEEDSLEQKELIESMLKDDKRRKEYLRWIEERDPKFMKEKLYNHRFNNYRVARTVIMLKKLKKGETLSSVKDKESELQEEMCDLFDDPSNNLDLRSFVIVPRNRVSLLEKVDKRCEKMLGEGLIEECLSLIEKGVNPQSFAANLVGYKHCFDFIKKGKYNRSSLREMIFEFQSDTRKIIRTQVAQLKKQEIHLWTEIESDEHESVAKKIDELCKMGKKEFCELRNSSRKSCLTSIPENNKKNPPSLYFFKKEENIDSFLSNLIKTIKTKTSPQIK